MIKGTQKQMIVVKTGESRYYDEAYFVLRRDIDISPRNREDFLREANRILAEKEFKKDHPVLGFWKAGCLFLAGIVLGTVAGFLLQILF